VVLGGAVELGDPELAGFEWAAVLRRPVTLGEIADHVDKLVRKGA
jgi:hypothetical protein